MARRVMGNYHARCRVGENPEIISKDYLSLSKYFMVSLLIQQLYREILSIADEKGGTLDKRVMFYCDELGTFPKIDGLEAMFSAGRSRKISIVAIIQSFAQLEQTYGKQGMEIITDNTQLTVFGGFAPNSQSAEVLSKALGEQTVLSGSVSHGREKSQSLQMIGRPLMTVDELKSMPKGQFIVMKTGTHPMISKLKLYFKWGIQFEKPYLLPDKGARAVRYLERDVDCQPKIVQKLFSQRKSFKLNGSQVPKRAVNKRIIEPMNIICKLK